MSKNKKPEKRVESEVLSMAHALGMSLDVIESKAVYSVRAKRYLRGSAPIGFCDLVGNDKNGFACYVELKDPKKKNNLSDDQREFLTRKIGFKSFACCTFSADHFQGLYNKWASFEDRNQAQTFLLEVLPKQPVPRHKNT